MVSLNPEDPKLIDNASAGHLLPFVECMISDKDDDGVCYVRAKYYFSSDDAEEHTTIIFGSEKWKKGSHDFYYYQDSIVPGEKTEPFITAVKIKKEGENLESFDLNIYTETVQSENHSSAEEAFGMFEKEGEGYET